MNNKMKFIMPRLLGLTVVAGVAVFILSIIFKLLLAGLVLAGIGTLAVKMTGKKRERQMAYGNGKREFLPYHNNFQETTKADYAQLRKENLAIIPIH